MTTSKDHFIVAIGASAGGLAALESFFSYVPKNTGMSYIVIQHLAPDHKSIMDELLGRYTEMPIQLAENRMEVKPDSVYLIPPNKEIRYADGRLQLSDREKNVLNLPIDIFFRSLAEEAGPNSIGVILSGSGSDGALGIRAIHEQGGLVLAQEPSTADFDSMPNSAILTGAVDRVLRAQDMPALIVDYVKHASTSDKKDTANKNDENFHELYSPIHEVLNKVFDVNFEEYKPATINRRIERRMALLGLRALDEYIELVTQDTEEQTNLYLDLLIGVTEFLRDQSAWEELQTSALPALAEKVTTSDELRIWIAGCATGEEAYTMAILIHEKLTEMQRPVNVRIFATDVHEPSLKIASNGVYTLTSLSGLGQARIGRYFRSIDETSFRISSEIRKIVVFARQNLISEPPFTKIDLICCRNLLIYFRSHAQRMAIHSFHFALKTGGYLFLGPSESLADIKNEFNVVSNIHRIYTKRRDIRISTFANRFTFNNSDKKKEHKVIFTNDAEKSSDTRTIGRDPDLIRAYDFMLEKFAPESVLVSTEGKLLHIFGNASIYFHMPSGVTSMNLNRLVHPSLRMAISTGLIRMKDEKGPISYGGIRVNLSETDVRILRVTFTHISSAKTQKLILINFAEADKVIDQQPDAPEGQPPAVTTSQLARLPQGFNSEEAAMDQIVNLEQELHYTRENLQSTVEELETSYEELQSTNEELMASNEELQSTNEELHSVNEELHTLNREHEEKISELSQLTSDMDNLLASTDIGTIFLDQDLNIRKFTPAVARIFSLLNQDIGRPITHLNRNIKANDFIGMLTEVQQSEKHAEYEVEDLDGNWYLMGIDPFINEHHKMDGLIVTFVNINAVREKADLIQKNQRLQSYAYAVSHDINEPLRNMSSFIELLEEKVKQSSDKESVEYLDMLKQSLERLGTMQNGMLEYSRVNTRGQDMTRISLNSMLQRARNNIAELLETADPEIIVDNLPDIVCDEKQIIQVLEELLVNAVRFKSTFPLKIEIKFRMESEYYLIDVKDNGIGIDPDKTQDIFRIFARLNPRQQYAGMGIGLAVVDRIMERHNGNISCTSDGSSGTTFTLKFPVIQ